MKKLIFMLFVLCGAYTFAGQEESDISYEVEDSIKTYDQGDVLLFSGGTLFTFGIVNAVISSRIIGFTMIGTGATMASIGGVIKLRNHIRKKKKSKNGGGS